MYPATHGNPICKADVPCLVLCTAPPTRATQRTGKKIVRQPEQLQRSQSAEGGRNRAWTIQRKERAMDDECDRATDTQITGLALCSHTRNYVSVRMKSRQVAVNRAFSVRYVIEDMASTSYFLHRQGISTHGVTQPSVRGTRSGN